MTKNIPPKKREKKSCWILRGAQTHSTDRLSQIHQCQQFSWNNTWETIILPLHLAVEIAVIIVVTSVRKWGFSNGREFTGRLQNRAAENGVWIPGELEKGHNCPKTHLGMGKNHPSRTGLCWWPIPPPVFELCWRECSQKMNILVSGAFKMNFKCIQPAFIPAAFVCSCRQGGRMRPWGIF